MATINYQQVKTAYDFFINNIGLQVTTADIANATGWKESTVRTYFNKKWDKLILNKVASNLYEICMQPDMSLDAYAELHSQVDEHLR